MDVHPLQHPRGTARDGRRRHRRRVRERDHRLAQDPVPAQRVRRRVEDPHHGHRREGDVPRGRRGHGGVQRGAGQDALPVPQPLLAGPKASAHPGEAPGQLPPHHGPARHRRTLPLRPGRHLRRPRSLRVRQDRHLPVPLQVLQLGRHRVRRVRRARQRDGGGPVRLSRTDHDGQGRGDGGREGGGHHEADHPRGQHVQHARGGAGGVHLHRHHPRRVLPRPGHERVHDGRLDLSVGRGPP
mmetsp:Transcript_33710/g.62304  ORF Transcript_33710/g.62304 Transcript_33710/m.62304 type:complete len:241 (+) Transcript_33710:433-1155(+)